MRIRNPKFVHIEFYYVLHPATDIPDAEITLKGMISRRIGYLSQKTRYITYKGNPMMGWSIKDVGDDEEVSNKERRMLNACYLKHFPAFERARRAKLTQNYKRSVSELVQAIQRHIRNDRYHFIMEPDDVHD